MDKVALRNFAVNAKEKLEKEVRRKLELIGITENKIEEGIVSKNDYLKIGNVELNKREIKQREILVKTLKEKVKEGNFQDALNELIEEIAYTWFNRIIAIRFMEVNDYLNDRIRILSSERENDREPQIIREVFNTDLELSDDEKNYVYNLKEESKTEELFRFLFIKKCNKLNEILPELFEEAEDYSELLLPISINDEEGILRKLVDGVPKESFDIKKEGQIEVIGWLYQYYNEEKKNKIVGMNKGTIAKEDIPTATQIFTTDWVVKYMIQNSLGKYWIERNPDSKLKDKLEYFVTPKNGEIAYIDEKVSPEEIKFLEPCMGSGHILVHAFDILMEIYREEGYSDREAVRSIIENNIYGLDIDKRAYQLAYFAVMMKGREYDRRFFTRGISPNVTYTEESYFLFDDESKKILRNSKKINMDELRTNFYFDGITIDDKQNQVGEYLIRIFEDAGETGSLIKVENFDYDSFDKYLDECKERYVGSLTGEIWKENVYSLMKQIVKTAKILKNKYHIVCTNPPYLNKYNPKLKKFVETNYKDYKGDLFSVFMVRVFDFLVEDGYSGWMTPMVWMFIKTYEELRKYIILNKSIVTLIQMEYSAFEEAVVPICSFILKNGKEKEKGLYFKLSDFKGGMEVQNQKVLEALKNKNCGYFYEANEKNFEKIPGMPVGYWVSKNMLEDFEKGIKTSELVEPKVGLQTGDNNLFLRQWYEVREKEISYDAETIYETKDNGYKWYPHNKGGERRQWYGNYDYVVNWENNGNEIRNFKDSNGKLRSRPQNTEYYFKEAVTWSDITSGNFAIRYREKGSIHDVVGMSVFSEKIDRLKYILGLSGTKISNSIFRLLNPTIHLPIGTFSNFPVIENEQIKPKVISIVDDCIKISKYDWNTFETAWDFKVSPLVNIERYVEEFENVKIGENGNVENKKIDKTQITLIEEAYSQYKEFTNNQFLKLKENEEELNRIFIDIYGLQDELTSDVSDKDITIAKIFDTDDEINDEIKGNNYVLTKADVVKQFISYAVGCMFGRYSLDEEGLAFAGGEFDKNKYKKFIPDEDNCIPITDSEYFSDDIVTRFVEFVKTVYGEETLEENLKFIAQALSNKNDAPKDIIREYFLKSFYDDHLKRYKKRPIYWLYDAGKKNGFKALIYMHRYNEQTTAKVRIGYLHELQKHYERRASFLKDEIESNNNRKKAEKELKKIKSQLDECKHFDEKMNHLASEYISIDLDDGVKVNYEKVQTGRDGKRYEILGKVK
jgi:conserved domain protein